MYESKESSLRTLQANIELILLSKVGQEPILTSKERCKIEIRLEELVNLKLRNQIDEIVYNEETNRLSTELNELRQQMLILEEKEDQNEKIKECR